MSKKKLAVKIMLALTLATAPAYAAEIPSYDMEEIIVSADAYQAPVAGDTVNVRVVSPGRAASVPDLLRQVAGIDVQMRASAGDNQDGTVKLRGFDAKRFTVLIDGRPATMSGVMGGSYVDWNAIPLNDVEKIQIIKGAKSAAYGNTLGGIINIITKKNSDDHASGNMNILTGENGQYQYLFNYGGKSDKVSWKILYNKYGEDAFLFNNAYDSEQFGAELGFAVSDKDELKFRVNSTEAKRGYIIQNDPTVSWYNPKYPIIDSNAREGLTPSIPGYSPQLNPGAYRKKDYTGYDYTWTRKLSNGSVSLMYWKNDEKRREVDFNTDGTVKLDRTVPADQSSGWQLNGDYRQGGHSYSYGMDYKQLRYGYGWYDVLPTGADPDGIYPSQKANLFGAYMEDTWQLDDRWTGNFGLRYDSMEGRRDDDRATSVVAKDYSALSPKLNFSFRNNAETTTFLSLNRLWRAPSMAEYYWWKVPMGGKLGTNENLKPEKGWEYEIGVSHKVNENYSTKLTVYYQNITDYINFTHQYPFSVYNIDQARLWGVEWQNDLKLNNHSHLFFNYTNQHTQKDGVLSGDNLGLKGELDYRPRHKATLAYQYDAKPWQFRYAINYTGEQTANYPYGSASVVSVGGYVVHDLYLTRELMTDSTITVAVNNLFDKDYVEQYNYPMQGRVFSVSYNHKL
jgi:outer membrane receptor protein involved in Fe transport